MFYFSITNDHSRTRNGAQNIQPGTPREEKEEDDDDDGSSEMKVELFIISVIRWSARLLFFILFREKNSVISAP